MRFRDIPKAIPGGGYAVTVDWEGLEANLARYTTRGDVPCDLDPDFQRGHVWTEAQQVAYVEAKLGGFVPHGTDIVRFNCPGWMRDFRGPMVLVDGKQRLTAARRFLADEITAYGYRRSEYTDHLPADVSFTFQVNNLATREEVLRWYLQLNAGGTPHAPSEIERVRALLAAEVGHWRPGRGR